MTDNYSLLAVLSGLLISIAFIRFLRWHGKRRRAAAERDRRWEGIMIEIQKQRLEEEGLWK